MACSFLIIPFYVYRKSVFILLWFDTAFVDMHFCRIEKSRNSMHPLSFWISIYKISDFSFTSSF